MVPARAAVPATALLVVLAGCSVLPSSQPPSDERALDALNRTTAAVEEVSTYRFSIDGHVRTSDGDRTLTATSEGAVDRQHRRLVLTATEDGSTRSTYVDGRTVYTECSEPWDGWTVENTSLPSEWFTTTPLGRQVELLEETTVYWGGNRTLDGNRTVVLVAHPSRRTLVSLPDGVGPIDEFPGLDVGNATFELWVDARTDRPVKSVFRIAISSGDASGTAEFTTRYRAYGEPATVSIPPSTRTDQYELGCPVG